MHFLPPSHVFSSVSPAISSTTLNKTVQRQNALKFGARPSFTIPRPSLSELASQGAAFLRKHLHPENLTNLFLLHGASQALGRISGHMGIHMMVTTGGMLMPKGRLASFVAATGFNAFINRLIPRIDRQLKTWVLLAMTSVGHMGVDRWFPDSTLRKGIVLSNRLDYWRLGIWAAKEAQRYGRRLIG